MFDGKLDGLFGSACPIGIQNKADIGNTIEIALDGIIVQAPCPAPFRVEITKAGFRNSTDVGRVLPCTDAVVMRGENSERTRRFQDAITLIHEGDHVRRVLDVMGAEQFIHGITGEWPRELFQIHDHVHAGHRSAIHADISFHLLQATCQIDPYSIASAHGTGGIIVPAILFRGK